MTTPGSWSAEFLVNTVTAGAQMAPAVAALADGTFAIAYTDYSVSAGYGFTDTSDSAVRVEIFNADGSRATGPIQVNTVTTYYQRFPTIAALADGGFAVAYSDLSIGWDSGDDDIWAEAVRMQRFTANGIKLGAETLVNTTRWGDQDFPSVAVLDTGRIVVTWDDGYDDNDVNVNAQAFDPDGTRIAGEVRINQTLPGAQYGSDVAALPGGDYVVTWTDTSGSDGDGDSIHARLFDATGTALGPILQVNTTAASDQTEARVAALASGGFVVAWQDFSQGVDTGGDDTASYAIRAQRFDAAGSPAGPEFLVNQTTTHGQLQPAVLGLADGRFIVAFCDTSGGVETGGDDPEYAAIRARIFEADGTPGGDEFLVNATTAGFQNDPELALLPDGRVVFTWSDYSCGTATGGDDTDSAAIRARILDPRTEAVRLAGTDLDDQFVGTEWNDRLKGGDGADTLSGGRGGDRMWGGAGNDLLEGDSGRDKLYGRRGADLLIGGTSNDTLAGGNGTDTLLGGLDTDILTGGLGADLFVFTAPQESRRAQDRRDTITDFQPGQDRIDLAAIDADPTTPEDDAFVFLGRAHYTGTPGEIRFWGDGTKAVIAADLDGDTRADMIVDLTGPVIPTVEDFIL